MAPTTRTNAEGRCPACLKSLTGATGVSDPAARPKPGDFSVCVYCTAVLRFNTDLTVRTLRAGELEDLPADMQAAMNRYRAALQDLHGWMAPTWFKP